MSKFWSDLKVPIAIAHRGGAVAYGKDKHRIENTLAAFKAAVKLGYEYLELDVVSSKDKEVVVVHVAKNQFEAGQRKKDAPSSKELEKLTHTEMVKRLGREVPTLKEVLKAFPDCKLFVDTKTDRVVEPLAKLITETKAQSRVCVDSFYPTRIEKVQKLLGNDVAVALNISRSPAHFLSQWWFLRRSNSLSAVHLPFSLMTKQIVGSLQKRGLKVIVWTPNNQKQIEKALKLGTDGIISDNIRLLKETLGKT
jgi:glycerophosphoryl diester phosphodiesterase